MNTEVGYRLAQRASVLHEEFEVKLSKVRKEVDRLNDTYHKQRMAFVDFWNHDVREFMNSEERQEYDSLKSEESIWSEKAQRLVKDAFELVSADPTVVWQKLPPTGVPGSWARKYYHEYEAKLDGPYSLRVGWYYVPLDSGRVHEDARESYSVSIKGSRSVMVRKGVMGLGRKIVRSDFPIGSLDMAEDDDARFKPTKPLLMACENEGEAQAFGNSLISFVKQLRVKLG